MSQAGSEAPVAAGARTRVLIVDDHPVFRRGLVQLVEGHGGFEVVADVSSAEAGVQAHEALQPHLTVLDLNMRGGSGLEALLRIRRHDPEALVVMLTVSDADDHVIEAMRAGATGYLLKDAEPEALLTQLERAAAGAVVLGEGLASALSRALKPGARPAQRQGETPLTEREEEILGLLAEGLSNKAIGQRLQISDGTVKVHVKNLLRKLQLRSRLEAAVWFLGSRGRA